MRAARIPQHNCPDARNSLLKQHDVLSRKVHTVRLQDQQARTRAMRHRDSISRRARTAAMRRRFGTGHDTAAVTVDRSLNASQPREAQAQRASRQCAPVAPVTTPSNDSRRPSPRDTGAVQAVTLSTAAFATSCGRLGARAMPPGTSNSQGPALQRNTFTRPLPCSSATSDRASSLAALKTHTQPAHSARHA